MLIKMENITKDYIIGEEVVHAIQGIDITSSAITECTDSDDGKVQRYVNISGFNSHVACQDMTRGPAHYIVRRD